MREIHRISHLDIPVLLRGETGSGKELAARALHRLSRRRDRAFVAVNLGAITPSIATAELFGAERGAFTGADKRRIGYFERADEGTLLLDEIGEAPLEVQAALLRVLETGEIQTVGAPEPRKVHVRVIAATDADLEAKVAAGKFRAALLNRLRVYEIRVPPLRERRDDIGRLILHFLGEERRSRPRRRRRRLRTRPRLPRRHRLRHPDGASRKTSARRSSPPRRSASASRAHLSMS